MEKLSEENMNHLKDFLAFPISLGMTYDQAMADGTIGLTDLPLLVGPSMKLMGVIQATPHLYQSIKDLNSDDKAELVTWAKNEFDLANDAVEKKIEDGLDLVLSITTYIMSFVK